METATARSLSANSAAKQGSSPAPARPSISPARAEARSPVQPVGGAEKAALTPAPSQQGEAAWNEPSLNFTVTQRASRPFSASVSAVRQDMRPGARSMSSTRASSPGGTKAVTDAPHFSQRAKPKP